MLDMVGIQRVMFSCGLTECFLWINFVPFTKMSPIRKASSSSLTPV